MGPEELGSTPIHKISDERAHETGDWKRHQHWVDWVARDARPRRRVVFHELTSEATQRQELSPILVPAGDARSPALMNCTMGSTGAREEEGEPKKYMNPTRRTPSNQVVSPSRAMLFTMKAVLATANRCNGFEKTRFIGRPSAQETSTSSGASTSATWMAEPMQIWSTSPMRS